MKKPTLIEVSALAFLAFALFVFWESYPGRNAENQTVSTHQVLKVEHKAVASAAQNQTKPSYHMTGTIRMSVAE